MPSRYRAKITEKILDWAETLPKAKEGYIHSLQVEREDQREEAQRAFERSRLSQDQELEFLAIRMIDLFQFEEFGQLKVNLKKMFPQLGGFHFDDSFEEYFEQLGNSLYPGWWRHIGWISRDKLSFEQNNFLLPSLPEEVKSIKVVLHKILPSIIVVTFDVYLAINASATLLKLHNQKYLPEKKLLYIHPVDKSFGTSMRSPDYDMEDAVIGWPVNIRKSIEGELAPHMSGYFMKQNTKAARLPAIEIFGLKRNQPSKEGLRCLG